MEPNRESNFTESIFDQNPNDGYKLWNSCPKDHPLYPKLINSTPLLQGFVGKRSSRKNQPSQIQDRFFVLTNNYLYFKKREDTSKISGFLQFKWARMEVHQEEYENQDQEISVKFTIKIIKNLKFTSLFFDSYKEFCKWKQALISVHLIQTDFHEKFTVTNRLGKGSFAKVTPLKSSNFNLFSGLQNRRQRNRNNSGSQGI